MAVAIVEPEIQQSKFQSHSISYRENVNVLPSLDQQISLCLRRSASIYPQIHYAPYLTPLQVHCLQWAQTQALYEGKFAIRNAFSCTLEMCQLLFKQIKHLEAYCIVYSPDLPQLYLPQININKSHGLAPFSWRG